MRESLRPWLESGLEYAYVPGGLTVEAQPDRVQAIPSAQAAVSATRSGDTPPLQTQPQARRSQGRPSSAQPQSAPPSPSGLSDRAAANFPAPWSTFLRFTKPDARVVMTYMELGLDLGGQSDPRRRSVLKNLQAHLKWPPGTINFWPAAALVDGALQPDTSMFWRGWELWHTPHVVCFGDEALKVILPDADIRAVTHLLENVIVHKLPPINRLVDMLPHEQQMAVDAIVNIRL
ncbi:hypothetical protein [Pseudodesulfovibrio methanolicus]|uniref:Uncharacterized protein n=1 Tax=Pseudodesulfovibrio methanolicus TaxID=3126690 RepID=A0ABZ2IYI7_9BACT